MDNTAIPLHSAIIACLGSAALACLFCWMFVDTLRDRWEGRAAAMGEEAQRQRTSLYVEELEKAQKREIDTLNNQCETSINALNEKHERGLNEALRLAERNHKISADAQARLSYKNGYREGVIDSHCSVRIKGRFPAKSPAYLEAVEEAERRIKAKEASPIYRHYKKECAA